MYASSDCSDQHLHRFVLAFAISYQYYIKGLLIRVHNYTFILLFQPKDMLWVLKRTVSLRQFKNRLNEMVLLSSQSMFKLIYKKINHNFTHKVHLSTCRCMSVFVMSWQILWFMNLPKVIYNLKTLCTNTQACYSILNWNSLGLNF